MNILVSSFISALILHFGVCSNEDNDSATSDDKLAPGQELASETYNETLSSPIISRKSDFTLFKDRPLIIVIEGSYVLLFIVVFIAYFYGIRVGRRQLLP